MSKILRHDGIVGDFEDTRVPTQYVLDCFKGKRRYPLAKNIESLVDCIIKGCNKRRFQVFMPKKGSYRDVLYLRAIHGHTKALNDDPDALGWTEIDYYDCPRLYHATARGRWGSVLERCLHCHQRQNQNRRQKVSYSSPLWSRNLWSMMKKKMMTDRLFRSLAPSTRARSTRPSLPNKSKNKKKVHSRFLSPKKKSKRKMHQRTQCGGRPLQPQHRKMTKTSFIVHAIHATTWDQCFVISASANLISQTTKILTKLRRLLRTITVLHMSSWSVVSENMKPMKDHRRGDILKEPGNLVIGRFPIVFGMMNSFGTVCLKTTGPWTISPEWTTLLASRATTSRCLWKTVKKQA